MFDSDFIKKNFFLLNSFFFFGGRQKRAALWLYTVKGAAHFLYALNKYLMNNFYLKITWQFIIWLFVLWHECWRHIPICFDFPIFFLICYRRYYISLFSVLFYNKSTIECTLFFIKHWMSVMRCALFWMLQIFSANGPFNNLTCHRNIDN